MIPRILKDRSCFTEGCRGPVLQEGTRLYCGACSWRGTLVEPFPLPDRSVCLTCRRSLTDPVGCTECGPHKPTEARREEPTTSHGEADRVAGADLRLDRARCSRHGPSTVTGGWNCGRGREYRRRTAKEPRRGLRTCSRKRATTNDIKCSGGRHDPQACRPTPSPLAPPRSLAWPEVAVGGRSSVPPVDIGEFAQVRVHSLRALHFLREQIDYPRPHVSSVQPVPRRPFAVGELRLGERVFRFLLHACLPRHCDRICSAVSTSVSSGMACSAARVSEWNSVPTSMIAYQLGRWAPPGSGVRGG